jgi:hypothetical protein
LLEKPSAFQIEDQVGALPEVAQPPAPELLPLLELPPLLELVPPALAPLEPPLPLPELELELPFPELLPPLEPLLELPTPTPDPPPLLELLLDAVPLGWLGSTGATPLVGPIADGIVPP